MSHTDNPNTVHLYSKEEVVLEIIAATKRHPKLPIEFPANYADRLTKNIRKTLQDDNIELRWNVETLSFYAYYYGVLVQAF